VNTSYHNEITRHHFSLAPLRSFPLNRYLEINNATCYGETPPHSCLHPLVRLLVVSVSREVLVQFPALCSRSIPTLTRCPSLLSRDRPSNAYPALLSRYGPTHEVRFWRWSHGFVCTQCAVWRSNKKKKHAFATRNYLGEGGGVGRRNKGRRFV
jgi:hypothetical protein